MESLTKREKVLIYILICFLIAVAGWFFLLHPALEKNNLVHAEYEQSKETLATLKQQLKNYEEAPKQLEKLEKSYNEIADQYSGILTNDDIDKLLTTKVLSVGLHPKSMAIGEISAAKLTSDEKAATDSSSAIQQSTIQMTLTGDLTKLKSLMNIIDKQEGLEIGSLSYQISNNEANTVSLSFILYMVNK